MSDKPKFSPQQEKIKACGHALMDALKPYDSMTRILTIEMVHAVVVVNETDYEASRHKQKVLDSFAHELDGFVVAKVT